MFMEFDGKAFYLISHWITNKKSSKREQHVKRHDMEEETIISIGCRLKRIPPFIPFIHFYIEIDSKS